MIDSEHDRDATRIKDNVDSVLDSIRTASARANRSPEDVTLIGVTKYVGPRLAAMVVKAGVLNLGESRPQELFEKREALSAHKDIIWHLIGSLQRNKARRAITAASLIQSADRWKLIQFLDSLALQEGIESVNVLLEVNISGDETKHGLLPAALPELVERMSEVPRVQAQGLMAMGGRGAEPVIVRRQFAQLRELAEQCRKSAPDNAPLTQLSMGMSGDYEIAVEEGATMVRVGSSLFQGVDR